MEEKLAAVHVAHHKVQLVARLERRVQRHKERMLRRRDEDIALRFDVLELAFLEDRFLVEDLDGNHFAVTFGLGQHNLAKGTLAHRLEQRVVRKRGMRSARRFCRDLFGSDGALDVVCLIGRQERYKLIGAHDLCVLRELDHVPMEAHASAFNELGLHVPEKLFLGEPDAKMALLAQLCI
eukprot:Amastigsp_a512355_51.p2 type:complete len:180 gc:universal Amastigsp_a512355_51:739-200(-)